jgi:transposase
VALNLICKLYGLEQCIKEKTIEDKFNIRHLHARPTVKELHHWLIKNKDKIPPKSKLGEAINYSLNQFDKF